MRYGEFCNEALPADFSVTGAEFFRVIIALVRPSRWGDAGEWLRRGTRLVCAKNARGKKREGVGKNCRQPVAWRVGLVGMENGF